LDEGRTAMNEQQAQRMQEIKDRYSESERPCLSAGPRTWNDIQYLISLAESLQREREQWYKRRTYLGIEENRLLLVATLLQQHGLTPEDVKRAADNFASAAEIATRIITGTFDEAMKRKFPDCEPKGEGHETD